MPDMRVGHGPARIMCHADLPRVMQAQRRFRPDAAVTDTRPDSDGSIASSLAPGHQTASRVFKRRGEGAAPLVALVATRAVALPCHGAVMNARAGLLITPITPITAK